MILLVLLSFLWFYTGEKIKSLMIFFFFITDGFQLVPEYVFMYVLPLKPGDYALLYMIGIAGINVLIKRGSFFNSLTKMDYLLGGLFLSTMFISFYFYQIPIVDIVKSSRLYFLFFAIFLFRNLSSDELLKLKQLLLYVTLGQSLLFCVQPFTGLEILNGYAGGGYVKLGFITIGRFYNIPFFGCYFLFYVFFLRDIPFKKKILYEIILALPILLCMHRSLLIAVIFSFILFIYVRNTSIDEKFRKILLFILVAIPFTSLINNYFTQRRGLEDIMSVYEGEYRDIEHIDELMDQTFLYRIAHFYERYDYLTNHPFKYVVGAGWMHESSAYTKQNFDFKVGLLNEDFEITQFDTSDITWSQLILRIGVFGVFLYLAYMIYWFYFFWKEKKQAAPAASAAFLLVIFITSFTNIMLITSLYFMIILLDRTLLSKKNEYTETLGLNYYSIV